ncbi:MAG: KH domain-containing protein [Candidatus ainarchaeum sp.]|nr:KH domain-containing protein [Candidatus ainarchaeum sp.]
MNTYLKIPMDRVPILIGKKGETRKRLEEITLAKIEVDSQTGDVNLEKKEANPLTFYKLESVIKAIGRGFSPDHALYLLDDDYVLWLTDLTEYAKSEKSRETKRSRVIGTKGAVRQYIEDTTSCFISVQGKTVAIIGKEPTLSIAIDSVGRLLQGSEIQAVKTFVKKAILKQKS